MMKRFEIQVLLRTGHTQAEVARLTGVPERTVRRVQAEAAVASVDDGDERERRGIGRSSKAERFRPFVTKLFAEEPEIRSVEMLRRAKLAGYDGGKTAFHDLVAAVRPTLIRPLVRFEVFPGDFTQHDFGEWTCASWTAAGVASTSSPPGSSPRASCSSRWSPIGASSRSCARSSA